MKSVAEATAESIRLVAQAIREEGGAEAVQLKVAENYVEQFGKIAKAGNTLILPANLADMGSLIATALTVVKSSEQKH
ncbi:hypothetical protein D3C87_1975890 [compost metagenome]